MANVLIVAYLLIVLALIAVILLQRSEGGGLGMGSSSTGLISVRGSANLLTRTTAILASLFFATAIGLTILSELDRGTQSILDQAADAVGEGAETPTTVLDALNALQSDDSLAVPELPATDTPAAPATDATPAADPALAVPSAATPAAPSDGAATPAPGVVEQPAPATPAAPVN